jgi:hypothetical protein
VTSTKRNPRARHLRGTTRVEAGERSAADELMLELVETLRM